MDAERFQRVMGLFQRACELPRAQRAAFLAGECNGDAALQGEVEALLAHDETPTGFVRTDDVGGGARLLAAEIARTDAPHDAAPVRIGRYRVVRKIGEGGMGAVYEAEQENPRRTVAVKVIRPGLATAGLMRRFEHEAQLLGRLQHPGIAQIFEAGLASIVYSAPRSGAAGSGNGPAPSLSEHSIDAREPAAAHAPSHAPAIRLPFLAMELIHGKPLTEYVTSAADAASRDRPGTRRRLELLARVCDAVQHAHQRGVIHRDLKPSNILVNEQGQPKILDFGVARTVESDVQVTTMQTSFGQLIGTLPYMSPEQVAGDPDAIDTRSDVYALGVLLYQLLTGRLPYDLSSRSIPEAVRMIQDEPPARLSSISRIFRGDLDTIVTKSLEKDKSRRYQSAAELGGDIVRYLNGDPIEAKRDSALYVLRKQLRRYRGAVTVGALFVLAVLTFGVFTMIQNASIRQLAEQESSAKGAAILARDAADAQRRRADEYAEQLAAKLVASRIEQGRLQGRAGSLRLAEDMLWPEFLQDPTSAKTHWALWELYSREPCISSILAHRGYVSSAVFSPDGRHCLTSSTDRHVRIWDVATGRFVRELGTHPGRTWGLAFFDNGTHLACAEDDGSISLWDVERNERSGALCGHDEQVEALSLSADERLLASAGADGRVLVWDLPRRELLRTLRAGGKPVDCVSITRDGRLVAGGGQDRVAWVWETMTGQTAATLKGNPTRVAAIAFSPDGQTVATGGGDGYVHLWDVARRRLSNTLVAPNGAILSLAFSPDGGTLAVGGWFRIDIWDISRGERRDSLGGHKQSISALAFSPDGARLASGSGDGMLKIWEMAGGQCLRRLYGHGESAYSVEFSPNGTVLATGGDEGDVRLWDAHTGRPLAVLRGHDRVASPVRFTPDGWTLVSASQDRTLIIWDLHTGECTNRLYGHTGDVDGTSISPDGRLILSGSTDRTIRAWDIATGACVGFGVTAGRGTSDVQIHPDGQMFAAASRENVVRLYDLQTGARLRDLRVKDSVWPVVYSHDGRWLALGTWTPSVEVYDAYTMQRRWAAKAHEQTVRALAFSPDDSLLASGSWDTLIKLWDTASGECVATLEGHTGEVFGVAFSPDGLTLASAAGDGSVGLWDLTYYDRHIAGNLEHQLLRAAENEISTKNGPRLQAWAERVTTRRWPRLGEEAPASAIAPAGGVTPAAIASWGQPPPRPYEPMSGAH